MIQADLAEDWPDGHVGSSGLFLLPASEDNSNVWLLVLGIYLCIPITILKRKKIVNVWHALQFMHTTKKVNFMYVFQ